jgi:hypothetical protein
MGYSLGHVDLRNKEGCLALEQRGDGVEFTLTRNGETRVVFKLTDEAVRELIERLQIVFPPYLPVIIP